MTREEAIINLKLSQNRIGGMKKEEWNALQMAIDALSAEAVHKPDYSYEADMVRRLKGAQSERPKGEWIPCSERLPEKDDLVLVTVWNDVVIAWRNRYGGWESVEDMYEKGDVTAWMPLPKPYKESEVEE